MKPKNLPLFYLSLAVGLLGAWLFAFSIYWVAVETLDPNYCCGANIGAGLVVQLSWLVGAASIALLVLSYLIKPKK